MQHDDGGIQIERDLAFQHANWRVERIGWIAMGTLVACAALGFFGQTGPLAHMRVQDTAGALTVEHERFVRRQTSTPLHIQVTAARGEDDVTLFLSESLLAARRVEQITPVPEASLAVRGGARFRFRIGDNARTSTIRIVLRVESWGRLDGAVGLAGSPAIPIRQLAFP